MAVDEINAAGGVLGRPLRIVAQDDSNDPADAAPAVQKLLDIDHIVALMGPTATTAGTILPIIDKANIPMMMFGGGAQFDNNADQHFFRMSPSDSDQGRVMAYYAHSKGWDKVALAFGSDTADQPLVKPVQDAAAKLGMTIVANVTFTPGASSYRSEIQQLFANKPDAVISQFNNTTAGVVFAELQQADLTGTPWVGANGWYTDIWFNAVGKDIATGPVHITNPSSGGMKGLPQFLSLLQTKYNRNVPVNGEAVMYDATLVWALGADKAGTTDWPAIEQAIMAVSNPPGTEVADYASGYKLLQQHQDINYRGASSSVQFDQNHNVHGQFDVIHYMGDGTITTETTISSDQLQQALGM
jgi:ABC-type branched-subunit amino acid transport system substrate-binding protein